MPTYDRLELPEPNYDAFGAGNDSRKKKKPESISLSEKKGIQQLALASYFAQEWQKFREPDPDERTLSPDGTCMLLTSNNQDVSELAMQMSARDIAYEYVEKNALEDVLDLLSNLPNIDAIKHGPMKIFEKFRYELRFDVNSLPALEPTSVTEKVFKRSRRSFFHMSFTSKQALRSLAQRDSVKGPGLYYQVAPSQFPLFSKDNVASNTKKHALHLPFVGVRLPSDAKKAELNSDHTLVLKIPSQNNDMQINVQLPHFLQEPGAREYMAEFIIQRIQGSPALQGIIPEAYHLVEARNNHFQYEDDIEDVYPVSEILEHDAIFNQSVEDIFFKLVVFDVIKYLYKLQNPRRYSVGQ